VSFYNESGDSAIWPTAMIGMLGVIEDYRLAVSQAFGPGSWIYLAGDSFPELGGSEFGEAVLGVVGGRPPALDLERERALHLLLVHAAGAGMLESGHDCAEGGLAVALAESAIAGGTGFAVTIPGDEPPHIGMFSESASRAVLSVDPSRATELEDAAAGLGVPLARLGETGGPRIVFDGVFEMTVEEALAIHENAIPMLLAG
jgi:phosphoribosylformylglycinamidine (FGAM) synthase-like enzyme